MQNLNERIKTLRRVKDITQEQLAEILGISPQAVSRWECGTTYPDIMILPQLAQVFGITVDALLGVNEQEKEAEINRIISEAEKEINQNITAEPIIMLRATLNRYPNNGRLLCTLMYALYAASEDDTLCREYDGEIIAIARRIQEYSTDNRCRNEANRLLFRHYCDTNRKTEALQVANELADMETCFQRNIYWALEGTKRVAHLKERIADDLNYLLWDIWAFSTHADISENEKAELDLLRQQIKGQVEGKFG